ncbi:SAM-dependent methyltransferase [Aliikangiella sp. G2MR2-5]|uniref:SAM-dependent methyltransferase n=1 Tax=Aliikangiella sp. G2MR2-5 TaxID=2788943 RepID=UPI0018AB19EA|nr:SAM-dependent methyltransferase [Aliikangiella sp. G2MR2-5]
MKNGSLVVVGSGIITPAHLSQESINRIVSADIVHLLVPDPLGKAAIEQLNCNIKDMGDLYYDDSSGRNGNNRVEAYDRMVDSIMADLRKGLKVCAVFYGHPGVFVYPSHKCISIARKEGFSAEMLPAISAEDCLFADLGIDPGDLGCQSYEATQYLIYHPPVNLASPLILWQIGVVGDLTFTQMHPADNGLAMLKARLLERYAETHELILYEAPTLPLMPVRAEPIMLANLDFVEVKTITTLYLPPCQTPRVDLDFCSQWHIDLTLV